MPRSRLSQVLFEPIEVGRERSTIDLGTFQGSLGREHKVITLQPSFVKTISRRSGMSRVQSDPLRYGDVRAEDIFPGSIQDIHIGNLSADKITTGTLDAGLVTISSDDGKMTLSDNLFQIKNASDVIQLSLGKYDGTNYGLAVGSNPVSPDIVIDATGVTCNTDQFWTIKGRLQFKNSAETLTSQIGYVINQFVISGDSTNGTRIDNPVTFSGQTVVFDLGSTSKGIELRDGGYLHFFRPDDSSTGLNQMKLQITSSNEFRFIIPSTGVPMELVSGNLGILGLNGTAGSYGGGADVIFITNRSTAPSSNPTGGGILYAEGGALKWRGSAGTTTTIAAA